jgi:hypothetical protein
MRKSVVALAALALLMLAAPAQARVRAGMLTCHVAPGVGVIVGSQKSVSCTFASVSGVGANVLVGGFGNSITLQPLSVGAQRGLNLAVAVSGLELHSVR